MELKMKALMTSLGIALCLEAAVPQSALTIRNLCPHPVWPAMYVPHTATPTIPELFPGHEICMNAPCLCSFRLWPRTGCAVKDGKFTCETGDTGGSSPVTLAEFSLDGLHNLDYYAVVLESGFNVPVKIESKYGCSPAVCSGDGINARCPQELQKWGSEGRVVGCYSGCASGRSQDQCSRFSQLVAATCPHAVLSSLGDNQSVHSCPTGGAFTVIFCPSD